MDDIVEPQSVIAGTNTVLVDALASTLLGLRSDALGFLTHAHSRGLGEIDLDKIAVKEFDFTA